jgi:hypothetical protein
MTRRLPSSQRHPHPPRSASSEPCTHARAAGCLRASDERRARSQPRGRRLTAAGLHVTWDDRDDDGDRWLVFLARK